MRERQMLLTDTSIKDPGYYEYMNISRKNANRFSMVDSKIPLDARVSGRSASRRSKSRESVYQMKRDASRSYSKLYDLKKEVLGDSSYR